MLVDQIKSLIRSAAADLYDAQIDDVTVDFPDRFGDVAVNCFYLARILKQAPPRIAEKLAERVVENPLVQKAEAVSGYLNLTLDRPALFSQTIGSVLANPEKWGAPTRARRERLMVEFSAPNTNKPQHLGHVRNNCLGDSVSRLLACTGAEVIRANLINDRGIHICKSMLAYQREGGGTTPQETGVKGDHFVGSYYVLFEKRFSEEFDAYKREHPDDSEMSKEEFFKISEWGRAAQDMLVRWEAGDPDVVALWRRMNEWVIEGFKETYAALGIEFDRIYLESETYLLGKQIIEDGLQRGVFTKRSDGAVEIDLTDEKLDKKVVLRPDGTSVYITQDIGTTVMKAEEYDLDGQIWVVGDEQIYHFKCLFAILRRLGYPWASNLRHLAYGMVHLPEGKMKSREGKVVDADDLINEVTELAMAEIRTRDPRIDPDELGYRAHKIGIAALKFMILSVTPQTTMTYDPNASVSFDGDTGPYVLYAFARIRRMIEDSGIEESDTDFAAETLGDPSEVRLVLKILEFPAAVERAARDMNPAIVTQHLLQLAKAYHSHNRNVLILKAEDPKQRKARLLLSLATATTLKRGLALLGIETVDRM